VSQSINRTIEDVALYWRGQGAVVKAINDETLDNVR